MKAAEKVIQLIHSQAAELRKLMESHEAKTIKDDGSGIVVWRFLDDSEIVCDQSGSRAPEWYDPSENPWDISDAAGETRLASTNGTSYTVPIGSSPDVRRVFRTFAEADQFCQDQRKEYRSWSGMVAQYIDGAKQDHPRSPTAK